VKAKCSHWDNYYKALDMWINNLNYVPKDYWNYDKQQAPMDELDKAYHKTMNKFIELDDRRKHGPETKESV